jgi:pimeloyl-ACP methyl ester carboxylesterase
MDGSSQADLRGVTVSGDSDATPVVFVHGVTVTRKTWLPQESELDEEFRVISFDLPGHGERADEEFRFEEALSLLDRVVETAADGNAVVVGLSLGGYLATAYAAEHGEKVNALVISGSSANPTGLLGVLTRVISAVSRAAAKSKLVRKGYSSLWERGIRKLDRLRNDQKREIIDAGFYFPPFGRAGKAIAGRDFRTEFGTYAGPALVLNGEMDLLSRRGEDDHAAAAPDTRVEMVDDAGHNCNLHRPAAYNRAVEQFYREALSATPPGAE